MQKIYLTLFLVLLLIITPILPAFAAVSVSITLPTSGATTSSDFTVTGTAEAGNEITVSIDGTEVGTTTADGSGDWSLDVTGQTDGAKTISASATGDTTVHIGSLANGDLTVLDASDDTEITGSPINLGGAQATVMAISPDGSTLYATNLNSFGYENLLYVVDLDSMTLTGTITLSDITPGGMVLTPDGSTIYVIVGGAADSIDVVDVASETVVDNITVIGDTFSSLLINSEGTTVYASNGGSTVHIIDTASNTIVDTIAVSGGAMDISPDDSTLYLSETSNPGNVYVVDTVTNTVTDTITDGNTLGAVRVSPDGNTLYVVSQNTSELLVIDTATLAVTDTIAGLGTITFGLDITPDGSKLYAVALGNIFGAGENSGVWTIDTATDIATFLTGSEEMNLASGRFIYQETATDSIDVTVSEEAEVETLADTGTDLQTLVIIATIAITFSGSLMYRYKPFSI